MPRTSTVARGLALAAALLLGAVPTAAAASDHGVRIHISGFDFTGGTCDGAICQFTTAGTATSNLVPDAAAYSADLVVDFSLGGSCNEVDESDTFAFDEGSIYIHSHHVDCREHGWRIRTDFVVTGGTGQFAGATGGGLEMGVPAVGIFYDGVLSN